MAESDLFEEMLATYPAEKRELAREVYHRFAEGDSTQFFSQLFLLLDVYAHYAERIPTRMISANADTLATIEEIRGEVAHIAKTIESRDASITNHAEKTDELCRTTQEKCNETIAAIELTVKNLGAQVDTKAIVQGIQIALESGIKEEIIAPFIQHTENLAGTGHAHAGNHSGVSRRSQIRMVKTDLENRMDDQLLVEHWGGPSSPA